MSDRRDNAAFVAVGAAACIACCAGPILAFLGAIGLGTVAGMLLFGAAGTAFAALAALILVRRRRRGFCRTTHVPTPVEMPKIRATR